MARYHYKVYFGSKAGFQVEAESLELAKQRGWSAWLASPECDGLETYWVESINVFGDDGGDEWEPGGRGWSSEQKARRDSTAQSPSSPAASNQTRPEGSPKDNDKGFALFVLALFVGVIGACHMLWLAGKGLLALIGVI